MSEELADAAIHGVLNTSWKIVSFKAFFSVAMFANPCRWSVSFDELTLSSSPFEVEFDVLELKVSIAVSKSTLNSSMFL
jgi:hypothetical protein